MPEDIKKIVTFWMGLSNIIEPFDCQKIFKKLLHFEWVSVTITPYNRK